VPAVLLVALALVGVAAAAPGDLDASFGSGGKVLTDVGIEPGVFNSAHSVAVQPNGKIVVVGGVNGFFVVLRYNRNGSRDQSFGSNGKVLTSFDSFSHALAVAVQADGKIVAAGSGNAQFELARYNVDGSLDPTFSEDGKQVIGFGPLDRGIAAALAIQPNGKIVAAGYSPTAFEFGLVVDVQIAVARFNGDGSLDPSFGSGGKVLTDFGNPTAEYFASAVVIRPNGKIVAVGTGDARVALVGFNIDGSLDAGFGSGGRVLTDFGAGVSEATTAAIQADGKIVAGGVRLLPFPDPSDSFLARYNVNGSLDQSFGTGGKVLTPVGVAAMAIDPTGKLVTTGNPFGVARYNGDGSLDQRFGSGGTVLTDFGPGSSSHAEAIAIQSNGAIVAAGSALTSDFSSYFALVRYLGH
jgi:uncharacterized delta-60 repeat protein